MKLDVVNPTKLLANTQEMDFLQLADFDAGAMGAFWCNPGDEVSPWEMHPDCDELLQIIEGNMELEVLPQDGGEGIIKTLTSGECVVVPQGCWHRQKMLERTQEFYLTPGKTLHSTADDPRVEE